MARFDSPAITSVDKLPMFSRQSRNYHAIVAAGVKMTSQNVRHHQLQQEERRYLRQFSFRHRDVKTEKKAETKEEINREKEKERERRKGETSSRISMRKERRAT